MATLKILYEDNHLLVVDKPAGIATMGTQPGQLTIARVAADYLKQRYHKPGKAFVGVVSRLDRLVSGVLILARTSKAASRLSQQLRDATVDKRYWALVEGVPSAGASIAEISTASDRQGVPIRTGWRELSDWVLKDERAQRMRVVPEAGSRAQLAQLRYRVAAHTASTALLEIQLLTGRKHQIRLQLSEIGHSILGDDKYGAQRKFPAGIALHCRRLTIAHPTGKQPLTFTAAPPLTWHSVAGELTSGLSEE